jgi:hypothetical protein
MEMAIKNCTDEEITVENCANWEETSFRRRQHCYSKYVVLEQPNELKKIKLELLSLLSWS